MVPGSSGTVVPNEGESWSPEGGEKSAPSKVPAGVDWSKLNQPFGEMKAATFSPTDQAAYAMQDAMMAGGANAYMSGHIAKGITGAIQSSPLGSAGSAADLAYHLGHREWMKAGQDALALVPAAGALTKLRRAGTAMAKASSPGIMKALNPFTPAEAAEAPKDHGPLNDNLDRAALSRPSEVNHKGKLDVEVSAAAGVPKHGRNLLKNTSLQRQTQMMPTQSGPMERDPSQSIMRGGT